MGILAALDRTFETTVTAGVGTYTLAGAQVGFQAFAAAGANNYVPYFATDERLLVRRWCRSACSNEQRRY